MVIYMHGFSERAPGGDGESSKQMRDGKCLLRGQGQNQNLIRFLFLLGILFPSSPECRGLQRGAGGLEPPYGAALVREFRPEWATSWAVHCTVHPILGAIEFPAEANSPDRVQSGSGSGWIRGENPQRVGNETAEDNG